MIATRAKQKIPQFRFSNKAIQLFGALAIGLVLTFELCSGAIVHASPTFPIRFNVGGDQPYTDQGGRVYSPDQEWTPQTKAGYIGGYPVSAAFPVIGGTLDDTLHQKQRRGWQEYRFSDIPNGDYLIVLHFSQIAVFDDHGPLYMVFDVMIEGQTVLDDFNVFSQVGINYALTRRFAVTVEDGELNIVARSVFGDPFLAAIEVRVRSPDTVAPPIPSNLTATNSYNAILLDWADSPKGDLDGYYVYRAESPDGPYTRLTAEPARISRYQDVPPDLHATYTYRVSAVDVYGNESDPTPQQSGVALDEDDATLPYYQLELSPENLDVLYMDPWSDDEVTGNFIYRGQPFLVEVRYRGNWGRYLEKKSWKIKFPEESPFPGQEEINLRSDFNDASLMRSKLATTLFEAVGIQPPRAEYVLLELNGEYMGVYICTEQVDANFAERVGHDPDVNIYKSTGNRYVDFSRQLSSERAYYKAFEKKNGLDPGYDDLIAFIERINNTPDEAFASELRRVFDVAAYLDYYAMIVLTGNLDFSSHNMYLFHDLVTDRWELIPYDFDNAFGPSGGEREYADDWPIDMGTPVAPVWGWVTNTLLTRVLDVPQFRAYYCHRLAEFMDTTFSDAAMASMIDEIHATIEQDALRDWHKNGWEDPAPFMAAPDDLKFYITERKNVLRGQMPGYCPADQLYLRINEIMVEHQTGLFSPWFEIYNAGLEEVDLSGMYLTGDLADPTRFQIANGVVIPAGGFVTFFADGKPWQGPRHTNFRLDGSGGQIGIFGGNKQIDAYAYGSQTVGVSEGRYPDGVGNWIAFSKPTPGRPNLLLPPSISSVTHTPSLPTAADPVTVVAMITDDDTLLATTLYYSATGSGFVETSLVETQENLYAALIPPQPDGRLVEYYILAGDNDGQTSTTSHNTYIVGYQPPALLINEFMADNETIVSDPDEADCPNPGEFPDWIELTNPGPVPVDLGGRYLTDDPNDPTRFRIADGITIPASGFVVFYADNDPRQGPFHTNFRLNKDGESVGLFDVDAAGNRPLDVYTFGPQVADRSEGRCADSDDWTFFTVPTPGATNPSCVGMPVISQVRHTPSHPSTTDRVTVTAIVTGDSTMVAATLWYSARASFTAMPMRYAGNNAYVAAIPAQSNGAGVAYYVQAESSPGRIVTDPPLAPLDTHYYLPGHQPPPLLINEFMASNVTALEDPDEPGEFPDWIELYNPGSTPLDMGGMYLTDDLADPTQFRIPDGLIIPAGGFVLFYADDDPEQGPFHTNFKLNRSGESVGLFDKETTGNQPVDTCVFGPQVANASQRRYPDGGEHWGMFYLSTPNRTNAVQWHLPFLPTIFKWTVTLPTLSLPVGWPGE
jgi:spore coat protein CotH